MKYIRKFNSAQERDAALANVDFNVLAGVVSGGTISVEMHEPAPVPVQQINIEAYADGDGMINGVEYEFYGTYPSGTTVTLTAEPIDRAEFVRWYDDYGWEQYDNPVLTFTAESDHVYYAEFRTPVIIHTVSAVVSPAGVGTIAFEGSTVLPSYSYAEGARAHLYANLTDANYYFVNWTVNGVQVGNNTIYEFTVTGDVTVQANFERIGGV